MINSKAAESSPQKGLMSKYNRNISQESLKGRGKETIKSFCVIIQCLLVGSEKWINRKKKKELAGKVQ